MFPLLVLGAAALLILANKSKLAALYKASFSLTDIASLKDGFFSGPAEGGPEHGVTLEGLPKLKSKLMRQTANLAAPIDLLTLDSLEQAAFYLADAGGSSLPKRSAYDCVCDGLATSARELGANPELYLSPADLQKGGVQWVGGFVLLTGAPADSDFLPGGALEGCVRVGDLESLRAAGFC